LRGFFVVTEEVETPTDPTGGGFRLDDAGYPCIPPSDDVGEYDREADVGLGTGETDLGTAGGSGQGARRTEETEDMFSEGTSVGGGFIQTGEIEIEGVLMESEGISVRIGFVISGDTGGALVRISGGGGLGTAGMSIIRGGFGSTD